MCISEPRHAITYLRCLRPGKAQSNLQAGAYRDSLECSSFALLNRDAFQNTNNNGANQTAQSGLCHYSHETVRCSCFRMPTHFIGSLIIVSFSISQGHNLYKLQYISPEEVKIVSFQQ